MRKCRTIGMGADILCTVMIAKLKLCHLTEMAKKRHSTTTAIQKSMEFRVDAVSIFAIIVWAATMVTLFSAGELFQNIVTSSNATGAKRTSLQLSTTIAVTRHASLRSAMIVFRTGIMEGI